MGPVTFAEPETERRYQEARGGLRGDQTLAGRMGAWLEHIRHGFTRHFIALPNTAKFAKAHEALRQPRTLPFPTRPGSGFSIQDLFGFTSPCRDVQPGPRTP